jgi:hypothetical protein
MRNLLQRGLGTLAMAGTALLLLSVAGVQPAAAASAPDGFTKIGTTTAAEPAECPRLSSASLIAPRSCGPPPPVEFSCTLRITEGPLANGVQVWGTARLTCNKLARFSMLVDLYKQSGTTWILKDRITTSTSSQYGVSLTASTTCVAGVYKVLAQADVGSPKAMFLQRENVGTIYQSDC